MPIKQSTVCVTALASMLVLSWIQNLFPNYLDFSKINLINGNYRNCDFNPIMASLSTGLESLNLGANPTSSQTTKEGEEQKTGLQTKNLKRFLSHAIR